MQDTCKYCKWQIGMNCHYYPPTAVVVMVQGIQGPQPQAMSVRAPVGMGDRCSKYAAHPSDSPDGVIDVQEISWEN